MADFAIASSARTYDNSVEQWKDGEVLFMRCSAWRDLGEHVTESLTCGTHVIASRRLRIRTYEASDGDLGTWAVAVTWMEAERELSRGHRPCRLPRPARARRRDPYRDAGVSAGNAATGRATKTVAVPMRAASTDKAVAAFLFESIADLMIQLQRLRRAASRVSRSAFRR
ncbi:single-stranded DNA-binding protein [Nonomuraea sp. NPDC049684]|uniref:single-stranded DNA-binding protein n=1 Tax=Nonomuraea sp. NPDC049684 TaxID=3364356 RepID=UPI0037AD5D6D